MKNLHDRTHGQASGETFSVDEANWCDLIIELELKNQAYVNRNALCIVWMDAVDRNVSS